METVNPTPEQLQKVLADTPKDHPVVMLNLLRFRERAQYKDETAERSGREAYSLYMKEAAACVREVGAEVIWSGRSLGSLIAPPDESWDQVLLVRYPSIDAFMAMIESQEYKGVVKHRTAALEDSRLVANLEGQS
ncbi:MAG: DUF1330 domain-containing protein [Marinobacter sp.]|jgi:uncharacterized protein (DUF1330 family)|uniref:DUF1330 domain-containing protein n=1 Tax=Marinobacter TaxID=2742 RepID=UPI001B0018C7|nr:MULTISPECIES: DUF1330 domain-containing protein [Marinobacter]MBO6850731.1 DUF1330 domain-containing protein [Marinobacter sp.]MCK7551769.1 DUF1330 domain-containing protein [Marinobacter goseongensis]MDV3503777.1 DUF1330 domain-containing protein [Marinobacter sp. M-5]